MRARTAAALLALAVTATAGGLPTGWWDAKAARPILEHTLRLRLAPDLSGLTAAEQDALVPLLAAGQVMQRIYEDSRHPEALAAAEAVAAQHARSPRQATWDLRDLYRLFQGPIATTRDNRRESFLATAPPQPGGNVYPWGVTKEEIEAVLQARPQDRDTLLAPRTAVRRADPVSVQKDLTALDRHPEIEALHPGLRARLQAVTPADRFYAVPYAVAWADDLAKAHDHLAEAARLLEGIDPEFAAYLQARAQDLLSNDYEPGDAAWIRGRFRHLNAQVGAYETYDDSLFGTKAFASFSLLIRDEARTRELAAAISGLQAFEDALPAPRPKKVREDLPVGVFDVVADFGQARGTNTATILPNDPRIVRKHGRTILIRANVLLDPRLNREAEAGWRAAVARAHAGELRPEGDFYRTLWHEIGHYLGPATDQAGRDLDAALQENADALEEMKADLASLFVAPLLRARGYHDEARLRAVQAAGIRRVLLRNPPRRDQAYPTMQLMQFNFFLEKGLLRFDRKDGLFVDYARYADVVRELLQRVLALQAAGDKAGADRFIGEYTRWDESVHGEIAARIRRASPAGYRLVTYAALGE